MPRRASQSSVESLPPQARPERLRGRPRVNINLASADELEQLPGVGPVLAARIVEQRERHGPFRRPEHLIIVRGFSERRFRELRPLITTGSDE
ncbi:MAG TPA: helix-hairpin-helix domain-containing protein [Pyrinomonadaceae bacterium]|nr:helix-hairpin-helix domain-containing protein [Pyrinomonadaceae bacterium]